MNIFRFFRNKKPLFDQNGDIVGRSIVIRDGVVEVDGRVVGAIDESVMTIRVEGKIENLTTDRSVTCNNVEGNIDAGGSVSCDVVRGDIRAGGSVNCDEVHGSVEAGGSVSCDDVGGDVRAGGSVTCDDIGGAVTANRVIT